MFDTILNEKVGVIMSKLDTFVIDELLEVLKKMGVNSADEASKKNLIRELENFGCSRNKAEDFVSVLMFLQTKKIAQKDENSKAKVSNE